MFYINKRRSTKNFNMKLCVKKLMDTIHYGINKLEQRIWTQISLLEVIFTTKCMMPWFRLARMRQRQMLMRRPNWREHSNQSILRHRLRNRSNNTAAAAALQRSARIKQVRTDANEGRQLQVCRKSCAHIHAVCL